jgi:hypothetical protein
MRSRLSRARAAVCAALLAVAVGLAAAIGPDTATPANAAGAAGGALEFRAAQQSGARTGPFPAIAGPRTVEAWVNPRTIAPAMILVNSDGVVGWLVEMDGSGYVKFWGADTGGVWRAAPGWGRPLRANAWAHVAVAYDGSVARVYVDGALAGSGAVGALSSGPDFRLGEMTTYPRFDGQIEEVRLSSGRRYTAAFARPGAPFAPDASTLALYHLDEGAGQVAADASGNGHDLTLGATTAAEASDPTWVSSTAPLGSAPSPSPTATATPTPTASPSATPSRTATATTTATATGTSTRTATP